MSLKAKLVMILSAILILFVAADFAVDRMMILPRFLSLEKASLLKDLSRAVQAIHREIYHLDSLCHDWSAWDETYGFVKTGASEYKQANLPLTTFTDNRIHLLYICDPKGRVVWGEIWDLDAKAPMEIPAFPRDQLPLDHPLLRYGQADADLARTRVAGVMHTEKGLLLVAARPILTSQNQGPVRGTFIMGRFLDAALIQQLKDQTRADFTLFPIDPQTLPDSIRNLDIPNLIGDRSPYCINDTRADQLLAFRSFNGVGGRPAFFIQARIPREISAIGRQALLGACVSMLAAGMAIIGLVLLLVEHFVLRPLTDLSAHALEVGKTGNLSKRLDLDRSDEIGTLAREFDRMLTRLAHKNQELAQANAALQEDIKERQKTEKALRFSERYYRSLLYSLQDDIIVVDRHHRITDMNRDFLFTANQDKARTMGYGCQELFPGFYDLLDPADPDSPLCQVFETGTPYTGRHRQKGTAEPVWSDLRMSPFTDERGEICRVIIAMRDVSTEARLEGHLRQSQKLEAIGTLAGGIAHDFNNILMSVLINTEFALSKIQAHPDARDCLEIALCGIRRARDLVEQLLTFSRNQALALAPLSVSPLIKEGLNILRASLPQRIGLNLDIRCERDTVVAAPGQIHQILLNLCTNAGYAMRERGGELTVRLETRTKQSPGVETELGDGPFLLLSVADTGRGIAPETAERIFDPFFTTKPPGEGTGMGLAVVHGIVKELGGAVVVRSQLGKGSRFQVFLPLAEPIKGAGHGVNPDH